jgi:hypothetical protein
MIVVAANVNETVLPDVDPLVAVADGAPPDGRKGVTSDTPYRRPTSAPCR